MAEEPTPLVATPATPLATRADVQPIDLQALFQVAIEKGKEGAESLAILAGLRNDMKKQQAATDFAQAMAAFQGVCPLIAKSSTAKIATKSGARFSYKYAELPEIARTIAPALHKHGLSYTWDSSMTDRMLKCTCIVSHVNGHTVSTHFDCPIDTPADMSGPQKCGAALTYAKRQALVAALGLTTCDPDDDGSGGMAAFKPIDADQVKGLDFLLTEVDADRVKFLRYFGIEDIEKLPVDRYDEAMRMLNEKRKAKA